MKTSYYEITTTKISRNNTRAQSYIFDTTEKTKSTLAEVKQYIIDNYGKIPRNKIYIDGAAGQAVQTGYIVSFWVDRDYRDEDHKKYLQTDWISIRHITSEICDFKALRKA